MYENGWGVEQNDSAAVDWYRKVAEQGGAYGTGTAQLHLGRMYENRLGVDQNYSTAVEWYRKAAEKGYVEAQFNLDRLTKSLRKRKNSEM